MDITVKITKLSPSPAFETKKKVPGGPETPNSLVGKRKGPGKRRAKLTHYSHLRAEVNDDGHQTAARGFVGSRARRGRRPRRRAMTEGA